MADDIKERLQHARDTAHALRVRLIERLGDVPMHQAPEAVRAELAVLDHVIAIAGSGIPRGAWAQQFALDAVVKLCRLQDACGASAELVRVVSIERFDQLEPVSAAVN